MKNQKTNVFSLSKGDLVIQVPNSITPEDFGDIEDFLKVFRRVLARLVVKELGEIPDKE